MREYIDNDDSVLLTQARQGPFKILTKNTFMEFKDDEVNTTVNSEPPHVKKYVAPFNAHS